MKSTATWVIGVLAVSLFIALGFWQLSRAEERKAIYDQYQSQLNATPISLNSLLDNGQGLHLYTPVTAAVRLLEGSSRYLVNRPIDSVSGVHHLALGDVNGILFMIDLGWLPSNAQGQLLKPVETPAVIKGQWRIYQTLGEPSWANDGARDMLSTSYWPWVDANQWRHDTGLPVTNKWVLTLENPDQSLSHRYHPPQVDDKSKTNIGYAGQWFLFALVTLILMGYFAIKGLKREPVYE